MGNSSRVTLVKSAFVSAGVGLEVAAEVDLGLAIGEMARILAIDCNLRCDSLLLAATVGLGQGVVSFDPDDVASVNNDDEQFFYMCVADHSIAATVGANKASEDVWADFTAMNLLTTRNLAIICAGTGYGYTFQTRVFYEKYVPTTAELTQMIAHRR